MIGATRLRPPPPWTPRVLALTAGTSLLGVVLLVVGWFGTSGEARLADQVAGLDLAVIGSAVAAAGQAAWLLHGRRHVGLLRRQVLGGVEWARPVAPTTKGQASDDGARVVVPGTTRYHRPGCLLVAGKATEPLGRGAASLSPCEVCRP